MKIANINLSNLNEIAYVDCRSYPHYKFMSFLQEYLNLHCAKWKHTPESLFFYLDPKNFIITVTDEDKLRSYASEIASIIVDNYNCYKAKFGPEFAKKMLPSIKFETVYKGN